MSARRLLRSIAALALVAVAAAQNPPAPAAPPVDPTLPDRMKDLKALVADTKMLGDMQALGLMQKLTQGLEHRNPKDKERLAKGFGDVFRTGKVRTGPKEALYRETADELAKLGADGSKEIAKAIADPRFKDNHALQAHFYLALGRTKDDKQVDMLLETTTRSPIDDLRAAAGEALGNFTELDVRPRREVVKAIVREWGSLHSKATTADPTDPNAPIDMAPQNARQTLRAVEGKWATTLTRLTGQSHSGFMEWQRWLNKNPGWTPPSAKKP
jgi:hypothetical protein